MDANAGSVRVAFEVSPRCCGKMARMAMRYTDNCPAVAEAFDPGQPISHSWPVHHSGMRVQDYHPACLWAQLQYQRERDDDSQYRENLEAEWQKRDLCSHCLLELDHPFMTEVDELRERVRVAESKLEGIRQVLVLPDAGFKAGVLEILEREEEPESDGE